MNVSEEIKQKRAAKKATRLSIWLSMENAKVVKTAMNRLRKLPKRAAARQEIVDKTLRKYTTVLDYHEHKFNLQNTVGLFHAVARLIDASVDPRAIAERHRLFIRKLCGRVRDQLQDLNGRSVCELLWALHKMRFRDIATRVRSPASTTSVLKDAERDSLIQSILERANAPDVAYNAQDRAILVHTLLKMQLADRQPALVQKLLTGAVRQISDFQPRDVSMLVWCLPQLKIAPPILLVSSLVKRAMDMVPDFTPQDIADTVHGLAQLSYYHCTRLCSLFLSEMESRLETFRSQELACVLWGFARLLYLPTPVFLNKVADVSLRTMDQFTPQSASNLILAYANFRHHHAPLTNAVGVRIVASRGFLRSQDVVNTAWAFAILECLDPEFMRFCLEELRYVQRSLPVTEKMQLYQCFLHMSVHHPDANVFRICPPGFLHNCRQKWTAAQAELRKENKVLDDILRFLKKEGYTCQHRHPIRGGDFFVATVSQHGVPYVVECISKDVRFSNQPNTLIGKTAWRENLLARYGYFMLRIYPDQWTAFDNDEKRREFFKRII